MKSQLFEKVGVYFQNEIGVIVWFPYFRLYSLYTAVERDFVFINSDFQLRDNEIYIFMHPTTYPTNFTKIEEQKIPTQDKSLWDSVSTLLKDFCSK